MNRAWKTLILSTVACQFVILEKNVKGVTLAICCCTYLLLCEYVLYKSYIRKILKHFDSIQITTVEMQSTGTTAFSTFWQQPHYKYQTVVHKYCNISCMAPDFLISCQENLMFLSFNFHVLRYHHCHYFHGSTNCVQLPLSEHLHLKFHLMSTVKFQHKFSMKFQRESPSEVSTPLAALCQHSKKSRDWNALWT